MQSLTPERVSEGLHLGDTDPVPERTKTYIATNPVCERCNGPSTSWKGTPNPLCKSCYETKPNALVGERPTNGCPDVETTTALLAEYQGAGDGTNQAERVRQLRNDRCLTTDDLERTRTMRADAIHVEQRTPLTITADARSPVS